MITTKSQRLVSSWKEFTSNPKDRGVLVQEGNKQIKRIGGIYRKENIPVLANSGYYWEIVHGKNLAVDRFDGKTDFALINFPFICNRHCDFCFTTYKVGVDSTKNDIPLSDAHEKVRGLFSSLKGSSDLARIVSEGINPLSLDDLKRFTEMFARGGGLSFEVSGWGESTLIKEFPEFVRHATSQNVPITLITNAELEPKYWQEVVETVLEGRGTVIVSLHHVNPRKHQKHLGGDYARVYSNLKSASEIAQRMGILRTRENGIDVYRVATHTTISPENIDDLKELQAKVRELGIFVSLAPIGLVGLAEDLKDKKKELQRFLYHCQTAYLPDSFQHCESVPQDLVSKVADIIQSFPHKGDNSIIHSLTSEILFSKFADYWKSKNPESDALPKTSQVCATFAYGITLDTSTGTAIPDAHGFELLGLLDKYPKLHEMLRGEYKPERQAELTKRLNDAWVNFSLPLLVHSGCFFCPVRSPLYSEAITQLK